MRYVALDVGDKRIGIAVSDPLGWTAQGVETYHRTTSQQDYAYLREKIASYEPEGLVVGLPVNMNGTKGPRVELVEAFVKKLMGAWALPVYYQDERMTTMAATQVLLQADVSRKKRKQKVDQLAAVLILQRFLDSLHA